MPLKFIKNAIVLSGETGTKSKTLILGEYYKFWLDVTTGGKNRHYKNPVCIIDMNAGTGEIVIEDTGELILGSAGHALQMRYDDKKAIYDNLILVLVESDEECRNNLLEVISRRWPEVKMKKKPDGSFSSMDGKTFILPSENLFLKLTDDGRIAGNCLFYFDSLRYSPWDVINRIAASRIITPYKTGTEFLVFFFTSDWIAGRTKFASLPRDVDKKDWSTLEKKSASEADEAFGGQEWLEITTREFIDAELMKNLVNQYERKLRKWFRFVQPLPFIPEKGAQYDLFCCSNYYLGMSVLRAFYKSLTKQPFGIELEANEIYPLFIEKHPDILDERKSSRHKPPKWKVFWHIIKNHIDGVADIDCSWLIAQNDGLQIDATLFWLEEKRYLTRTKISDWPWKEEKIPIFSINWKTLESVFGIPFPKSPIPLTPELASEDPETIKAESKRSIKDFY